MLFGFLLSIPFTTRFVKLSHAQHGLYVAALLLAATATALLLAPVAYHRLVFRMNRKEQLVKDANILAILGLAAVGLAVSAVGAPGGQLRGPWRDGGARRGLRGVPVRGAVVRAAARPPPHPVPGMTGELTGPNGVADRMT